MIIKRMLRNKKGVELSMNTIIIAAIALIVLIVLVLILTGQAGKLGFGLRDCASRGGSEQAGKDLGDAINQCVDSGGVIIDNNFYYKNGDKLDKKEKSVCCRK